MHGLPVTWGVVSPVQVPVFSQISPLPGSVPSRLCPALILPLFCISSELNTLPAFTVVGAIFYIRSFDTHLLRIYNHMPGRHLLRVCCVLSTVLGTGRSVPSRALRSRYCLQALSWGGPPLHSDLTFTKDFYFCKVFLHPLSPFIHTTPLYGRREGLIIPLERQNH